MCNKLTAGVGLPRLPIWVLGWPFMVVMAAPDTFRPAQCSQSLRMLQSALHLSFQVAVRLGGLQRAQGSICEPSCLHPMLG